MELVWRGIKSGKLELSSESVKDVADLLEILLRSLSEAESRFIADTIFNNSVVSKAQVAAAQREVRAATNSYPQSILLMPQSSDPF